MAIAPEPVLRAGLETLYWATTMCRNWTYESKRPNTELPSKLVHDLMDAINHLPEFLADWDRPGSGMETLLLHLSCFDHEQWKSELGDTVFTLPDLVSVFKDRLERAGGSLPS